MGYGLQQGRGEGQDCHWRSFEAGRRCGIASRRWYQLQCSPIRVRGNTILLGCRVLANVFIFSFSCDNIKGFQIVTSDGEIRYASENENPDLYKVLRGGQANFGIVTRFDMEAFPQGEGYTNVGTIILKTLIPGFDLTPRFLKAVGNFVTSGAKSDPKAGAIAVITNIPAVGISLGMFDFEPQVSLRLWVS